MSLSTILLPLGFLVLAFIAELVVGDLLRPAFTPLARLLRPPHGAFVLAGVWAATLVAVYFGFININGKDWWVPSATLVAPVVALLATVTYRDERREMLRLPPARAENQTLSVIGRAMAGILSLAFFGVGVFAAWMAAVDTSGELLFEMLSAGAGGLLIGGLLAYAAINGRFPHWAS